MVHGFRDNSRRMSAFLYDGKTETRVWCAFPRKDRVYRIGFKLMKLAMKLMFKNVDWDDRLCRY